MGVLFVVDPQPRTCTCVDGRATYASDGDSKFGSTGLSQLRTFNLLLNTVNVFVTAWPRSGARYIHSGLDGT